MLAYQFWTVSSHSPREPTGWGSAPQTFNGKFVSAGLQFPAMYLYGGSEGSPYTPTQFLSKSTATLLIRYRVDTNHLENQICVGVNTPQTCATHSFPNLFKLHSHYK